MKKKAILYASIAIVCTPFLGCSPQADTAQVEQTTSVNVSEIEDALTLSIKEALSESGSQIRSLHISENNLNVVFTYNKGRNFSSECAAVVDAINSLPDNPLEGYDYSIMKCNADDSLLVRWGSSGIYMNCRSSDMRTNVTLEQLAELEAEFQDSDTASPSGAAYTLLYGDLISSSNNDGVVVLKAKIQPSATNKMTIDQNYYNVCDLIKNHGLDAASELQYWAVADMTDGTEGKVISFTIDSEVIKKIKYGEIIDNQLGKYVSDLWILPSLQ